MQASAHSPAPVSAASRVAASADIAACRALLRENSRTFFAASLLLPRHVREPASALYAFCRLADDAIDLGGGQPGAVAALRDRLDRAYHGRPMNIAADRALAATIEQFALPRALPEALLEGFEWDAAGRRYEDIAALRAYGARVAGTVGAMMAVIMGVRNADALARACDLGVAMQLSNIARDVGEDARAGRVYLPLAWLREAGIDADAFVARPAFTPALGTVVRRLLDAADVLYDRVEAGVAQLPPACRPGINAARFLYAEVGREVERAGLDSVSRRAVVPARRKAQLLARALLPVRCAGERPVPPLDETRFLVEAVVRGTHPAAPAATCQPEHPHHGVREARHARKPPESAGTGHEGRPRNVEGRGAWLIGLFERLERMERSDGGQRAVRTEAAEP